MFLASLRSSPKSATPTGWPHSTDSRFLLTHFWMPLVGIALLLGLIAISDIDAALADGIYAWEGNDWALRRAFSTEVLIHQGGHDLSLLIWCIAFGLWLWSMRQDGLRELRKPLAYLVTSTLLATLLVAWTKSWTNMDCPWDLARYGGSRPFVSLFELRPVGLQRGVCFPAGHASSGYAWVALYFYFAAVRPQWRGWGLAVGIFLGLLFGVSQQLRGAHFLSHDIWALGICWVSAVLMFLAFNLEWLPGPSRIEGAKDALP